MSARNFLSFGSILFLLVGCSSDEGSASPIACEPGETTQCSCGSSAPGEQTCNDDGTSMSDCVCQAANQSPDAAGPAPSDSEFKSVFPAVSDFAGPGSFVTSRTPEGPDCEVFRPATLGEGGVLHPIIVWGNGTFTTPEAYWQVLDHWATHGFFVIAAVTSNAGTGIEMIACLEYALTQYAGQVDPEHIGTAGHSQGGGGAIMAGRDPRVKATVPLQPFVTGLGHDASSQSQQHGPMLLFSGTEDTWAPPDPHQQMVFDNSNVPTFWANRIGADHLVSGTNDIDDYRAPATAWFRLHLMGDESGRGLFYGASCGLCTDPGWIVQQKGL